MLEEAGTVHDYSRLADAGLSTRAATSDDESFLFEVYAGTRLLELEMVPWGDEQKLAFIKMQFDAREAQYRAVYAEATSKIVLRHSKPIGAMLVDRREGEIALVDIALLPQFQNTGLGTVLMKALMDEAAGAGMRIRLHVLVTSAAVRFYERLGFSSTSQDGAYLEMIWKPDSLR